MGELVFLPTPGVGHLVSTVKFATQFLDRDDRFSATILVMRTPFELSPAAGISNPLLPAPPSASATATATARQRIRYVHLPPPVDPPPSELLTKAFEKYYSLWIESHKTQVKNAIIDHILSATDPVPLLGLVVDLFCTSMIDVGNELGVDSYIFFTSNASFLGFMLHLEDRAEFEKSDADAESTIPGFFHPVPNGVLPLFAFNKNGGYSAMATHGRKFKEAKGIIINTFSELELHALSSISEYGTTPPIYTVGPVIDLKSEHHRPSSDDDNRSSEIMAWLDEQPPSSVVFLCFGSRGSFNAAQAMETAHGLESSGKRFLLSMRRPPPPENRLKFPSDYDNLDDILPDGFQERIKGRGMVCGWVRQVDVLAHSAIGAFVSHCGWNSVLESIWHAVPLVAWPQYAEQQMNAFKLVRDLGLAVEMKIDYRKDGEDVVNADQIETAVRRVMDMDSDSRKKVKEISEKSRNALIHGGSSYISLGNLIDDIISANKS